MILPILDALRLSLWVALTSTVLVLPIGSWLAYLMARHEFRGKQLLSAVAAVPLVLPPTAVGYLLLRLLASDGPLGRHVLGFDLGILLTWKAAVLASSVMSFPLVFRTARVTFEAIEPRLEGMARTLGHGPVSTLFRFTLPMAARGLVAAAILGFTRAVGEFGATVMIAGNIPGRTQTLASAIYSAQQSGRGEDAYVLLGVAVLVGLISILASERLVAPRRAVAPARRRTPSRLEPAG